MRLRIVNVCGVVAVTFAAALAACGGGNQGTTSTASGDEVAGPQRIDGNGQATGQAVDPSTAGTVSGVITFDGIAPKNEALRMNADPICVKENPDTQLEETVIVGGNEKTLANVFVYVKDGLANYRFATPSNVVVLDQKQCRYVPHVLGAQVGQPVEIRNSDPTLHNIHAIPEENREFNTGQPVQGMKHTHTFTTKEVMVPLKCDVHSWMRAYIGVLDHPFFAVTGPDGRYSLKGLPPGTYTVGAWHESLGAQTQTVTISASESKDVAFTFRSKSTT